MAKRGQKLLAAGTTMLIAEPLLVAAAHQGMLGAIVGVGAGLVAYNVVEDLEKLTGKLPSLPAIRRRPSPNDERQLSKVYRLLNGKSTRDSLEPESQEAAETSDLDLLLSCSALYLGKDFVIESDEILSRRIGLFGLPGSGKSNAVAVFVEEIGKLGGIGVPLVLADTEGEAEMLLSPEYLIRPYRAGSHNVTPENAFEFGKQVLERGHQVILNLQSYEDDDTAALVMIEIIRGMTAWADSYPNDERATCFFILDEATVWLPQRQEESGLSKIKDENGRTILQRLQRAFFSSVVRRGRKRGIGFVFATQRPADLDNRAISCNWYFLFRQTLPADLKVYGEIGVNKQEAMSLSTGQCLVMDPQGEILTRQWRKRSSPDIAKSPGLSSLSRYALVEPEEEAEKRIQPPVKVGGLAMDELVKILERRLAKSPAVDAPPDEQPIEETVEQLRRMPYQEYLKSAHWQKERKGALGRADYRCQVCNAADRQLDVHHRTYEHLGAELPGDLTVLCETCHEMFSKSGRLAKELSDAHEEALQASSSYVAPPKLTRSPWKYEEYYQITQEAYRLGYTGKRKLADFIREYGKHFEVEAIGYGKALDVIGEMRKRGMLEGDEEEEENVE